MKTHFNRGGISFCMPGCLVLFWVAVSVSKGAGVEGMAGPNQALVSRPYVERWIEMVAREPNKEVQQRARAEVALNPPAMLTEIAASPDAPPPASPLSVTEDPAGSINTGFTPVTEFPGTQIFELTEQGMPIPPDTMGAVGSNHFVEILNGAIAIYDKSGNYLGRTSLESFFAFTSEDQQHYPRTRLTDPRVLFDRQCGRWLASALEATGEGVGANHVLLAISATDDPMGEWSKFLIAFGQAPSGKQNFNTDFDTLGADMNGVYLAAAVMGPTNTIIKIAAIWKESLLSERGAQVYYFTNVTGMYSVPQPAHNYDLITSNTPAWFVAGWPYVYLDTELLGNMTYRKLVWKNAVPYLDKMTSKVSTPTFARPITAPALGGANIDTGDARFIMAVIRGGYLWTGRTVGLDATGNPSCGSCASRTGCEWLQLKVLSTNLTLGQHGRVFDRKTTNPMFYYYPSLMVNGQGHVVMAFSGSSKTNFAGAYYTWRLASDSANTMRPVHVLKTGEDGYTRLDSRKRNRWGDFSFTSLDPADDMTIWTVQEYVAPDYEDWWWGIYVDNNWATWIAALQAPSPVITNCAASFAQGALNAVFDIRGKGFFDGTNLPNRLHVQLAGGSEGEFSNWRATYLSATDIRASVDIALDAEPGCRDIIVTNPDGQSAVLGAGFTILPRADIAVSDISAPPEADVAEEVPFIVTLSNLGPREAWGVKLVEIFPTTVCITRSDAGNGFRKYGNNIITNYIGTLESGGMVTVTVWAIPSQAGSLTNHVCALSDSYDVEPGNNQSTHVMAVLTKPLGNWPTLAIDDIYVREGDVGTTNAIFRVTLLPSNTRTVTVYYATVNGTALAAVDYEGKSGSLLFLPGQTTKTLSVGIKADLESEISETFYVRLMPNRLTLPGRLEGTCTILDNDMAPLQRTYAKPGPITIPDFGKAKPYASTNVVFGLVGTIQKVTVSLTNLMHPDSSDLDVLLVSPEGQGVLLLSDVPGAFEGAELTFDDDCDYMPYEWTAHQGRFRPTNYDMDGDAPDTFPVPAPTGPYGDRLAKFTGGNPNGAWRLFVVDDTAHEQSGQIGGWNLSITTDNVVRDADLSVNVVGPIGPVAYGSVLTYTVTVSNECSEAAGGVALTDILPWEVRYGTAKPKPVTVANNVLTFVLGTMPAGASTNVTMTVTNVSLGIITNQAGVASRCHDINPANDTATHTVAVLPMVSIKATDANASESSTNTGEFTISRTGGTTAPLTVYYMLGGTAGSEDYSDLPGMVTIPKNASSAKLIIKPANDAAVEMTETVVASILPDVAYLINPAASSASVSLLDNDLPLISISDASVLEGNSGTNLMALTVMLSAPTSRKVSAHFATANSSAIAGSDYLAKSGTLTFAAGTTNQTIYVGVLGDTIRETNEIFYVRLSSPTNGLFGVSQAICTIVDDDTTPAAPAGIALRIDGFRLQGAQVVVSLNAQAGESYALEQNSNPANVADWTELMRVTAVQSGPVEIQAMRRGSECFYRLRKIK